jgi:hypothetical protein
MPTLRRERETSIIFDDEARLQEGNGRLFTFNRRLVEKALRAGGRIVEEHRREGRIVAWDVDLPVSAIRIAFRARKKRVLSAAQREAAAARARVASRDARSPRPDPRPT